MMTPAEQLWWHQSRLLANAVTFWLRRGIKRKRISSMKKTRGNVDCAMASCRLLIDHLKAGAPE